MSKRASAAVASIAKPMVAAPSAASAPGDQPDLARPAIHAAAHRHAERAIGQGRPAKGQTRRRAFDNPDGATLGKRVAQARPARPFQAVGQPDRVEPRIAEPVEPGFGPGLGRFPGHRRQGTDPVGPFGGGLEQQRARRRIGQAGHRHRPAGASGGRQFGLDRGQPGRPVLRRGPGTIGKDQQRAAPLGRRTRVQDRPGKSGDQQRDGQRAQQQQPPGRAIGLGLGVAQSDQQGDRGEPALAPPATPSGARNARPTGPSGASRWTAARRPPPPAGIARTRRPVPARFRPCVPRRTVAARCCASAISAGKRPGQSSERDRRLSGV
jgi:hypothetical protein